MSRKNYLVSIIQTYEYIMEAENEEEAVSKAERKFRDEMSTPIARTWYDDYEVECLTDEDEDEGEG